MSVNLLYVIQNDQFGGGERGFSQLIRGLDPRIFKVFVATTMAGRFYQEIRDAGATVINIPFGRLEVVRILNRLVPLINDENIQLIHSQGARADFFARIAGRLGKVPGIVSTIQMPVEGFNVSWPRKLVYVMLDRFSERFVDRFIVVSHALNEHLSKNRRIAGNKIALIYNGVELDTLNYSREKTANIRKEFNISPDSPLIAAAGRMVWQKGFEYFIRTIPKVVYDIPEAKFLLVGDGPLRTNLESLARDLKVDNTLLFTGFRSDIQELLAAIDILTIPSILEGFPMITLEAMAMATPIVATQIQGMTEQISNGKEGILVPPKNSEALAAGLLRMITDKSLASKLSLAARRRAEKFFSVEQMVSKTQNVYLSLLK